MATYTTSAVIPAVGTSANLQAWVAAWDSILTAAGWVQTADTGQTASGSFVGTASLNTSQGYQIWRMADSLQSTYPVFVKFEWGTGSTANFPTFWITIGTGSNGSGTITGIIVPRGQYGFVGATNATALPIYASGTTSRLTIYNFYSVTLNTFVYLNIERSKDASQADTGLGILFHCFNGGGSGYHCYAPFTGTTRYGVVAAMPLVPTYAAMGTGSDGASTIMVLPVIEFNMYGTVNYGIGTLAYYNTDMTTGNQYTVAVNGVNHNYYALRGYNFPAFTNWTGSALLMLYE